jgi:hypothetical protein
VDSAVLWLFAAGIAIAPMCLCWKARFWSTALLALIWIVAAIWAWSSATDARHLDYALSAEDGDPAMIFAVGTVFYGLPLYVLGALLGCVLHFRGRNAPSSLPGFENTDAEAKQGK